MQNIVKQLEWDDNGRAKGVNCIYDFGAAWNYHILYVGVIYDERGVHIISEHRSNNIEEVISFCQQHYNNAILSTLTDEAKTKLGIF